MPPPPRPPIPRSTTPNPPPKPLYKTQSLGPGAADGPLRTPPSVQRRGGERGRARGSGVVRGRGRGRGSDVRFDANPTLTLSPASSPAPKPLPPPISPCSSPSILPRGDPGAPSKSDVSEELGELKNMLIHNPEKGWRHFIPLVFGNVNVEVESEPTSPSTKRLTVIEQQNGNIVFSLLTSEPYDEFTLTKNATVLSLSQLVAVCKGGILPGSVYRIY
mmetsp:Transcript_4823/g.13502  ORF Transcript_4823/g.13502 Transcript_4823/m.13502 type:complete len:218 (+) Transcript_4823:1-654(+)